MDVFCNFHVPFGGLQILPNGEHITTVFQQIVHDLEHLFLGFAQACHHTRFGAFASGFGAFDLLQTALVFGLRANLAVKARNGFHVVGHHLLARADHQFQSLPFGPHIGNEGFNGGLRRLLFDLAHGLVPDFGPFVFEFVSVDRSDHRVFDLHESNGFGHPSGLIGVQFWRTSGGYRTKRAGPRTHIAQDHKSSGTFAPTFAHIGTMPTLANGVQLVLVYQLAHPLVILPHGKFDP